MLINKSVSDVGGGHDVQVTNIMIRVQSFSLFFSSIFGDNISQNTTSENNREINKIEEKLPNYRTAAIDAREKMASRSQTNLSKLDMMVTMRNNNKFNSSNNNKGK